MNFSKTNTMKTLTLLGLFAIIVLSACGKKDNPDPDGPNSSYHIKFLNGSLAGKEFKGSAEVNPAGREVDVTGRTRLLLGLFSDHEDFYITGLIGLGPNDEALPFGSDMNPNASPMLITLIDDGVFYHLESVSGNISIKNLRFNPVASYELSFENAVFNAIRGIGTEHEEEEVMQVSGTITIK